MIVKPKEFEKDFPEASVIIPIFQGEQSPHYLRLLADLKRQTFQNFEIICAVGISPNGRARNEGVVEAKGNYFIFIDETFFLTSEKIFENLLRPFSEKPKVGIVGASCGFVSNLNWIQRQYFSSRGFEIPAAEETSLGRVQHGCMAISRKAFTEAGGESDRLITGTDNDLTARVTLRGYDILSVPHTHVLYQPPRSFLQMLRKSFLKGRGSAFAFIVYPGLFELSPRFKIRTIKSAIFFKTVSLLSKFIRPFYLTKPVILICELFIWAGFIAGCLKWRHEKPDCLREDLRWKNEAV